MTVEGFQWSLPVSVSSYPLWLVTPGPGVTGRGVAGKDALRGTSPGRGGEKAAGILD